jgi:hypothetical protein
MASPGLRALDTVATTRTAAGSIATTTGLTVQKFGALKA